jgi:hypothetical protein
MMHQAYRRHDTYFKPLRHPKRKVDIVKMKPLYRLGIEWYQLPNGFSHQQKNAIETDYRKNCSGRIG